MKGRSATRKSYRKSENCEREKRIIYGYPVPDRKLFK